MPSATIIGAGPGLGLALATRFVEEGLITTVVARRTDTIRRIAEQVRGSDAEVHTMTADVSDESSLLRALDEIVAADGLPEIAVYNAGLIQQDGIGDLSAADQAYAWSVNVVGAITAAVYLLPRMAERGHGTLLMTGGMPSPVGQYASLSLGKAGLRALGQMLAAEYHPRGVHVATVTIPGAIAADTALAPELIAEHYWQLHGQPATAWQPETTVDDHLPVGQRTTGRRVQH